ncbi:MAG: hypothetical protein WCK20_00575, partial [Thermoleophilia bacterium]
GSPLDPIAASAAAQLLAEPLGGVPIPTPAARAAISRVCRETAEHHGGVRLALLGQGSRS